MNWLTLKSETYPARPTEYSLGKAKVIETALYPYIPISEKTRLFFVKSERNERVFQVLPRSLGMKFHIWAKKAEVLLHTHSFRHYFTTKLVEKGANIRVV